MRTVCTFLRHGFVGLAVVGGLLAAAPDAAAQGFGVGGRFAWVKPDVEGDIDVDSVRYFGGQVRLMSRRVGLELSLDRRSESFDDINQKVTETPIQASLLLRLAGGSVAPYLLGGPGWYRHTVEPIDGPAEDLSVTTTDFGWHAGIGLEILPNRHFGIHGDYRYTFLDFGDDEDEGFIGSLIPGHKGSMWTLGATFYF